VALVFFEDVSLEQKIALVLGDLEMEIQEKGAVIIVGSLPVIKGHKRQIQQIFQNLIGNALKYSRAGVIPEIYVSSKIVKGFDTSLNLSVDDPQKQFYLIEVKDNGIGFKQDDAERIFNVFTRLHGTTEYMGTGVGLTIVRKAIENHNGFITAESEPGKGATFKIFLPLEI
jgi:signal transduction histidine kinase